jgi:hypothetical protein
LSCAITSGSSWPFYYEEEPGRRSAAKLLTKGGARRIAANIAKLPDPSNDSDGRNRDLAINIVILQEQSAKKMAKGARP